MKNKLSQTFAVSALVLGILQIIVVLLSWLINAANGSDTTVRSMLSAEGVRWFFGHFADNLATPYLVWIVLIAIAYGTLRISGLYDAFHKLFNNKEFLLFRERIALYFVFAEIVGAVIVMLLLTVIPHAILLSVNGNLFPSSFSQCLIPVVSFVCALMSVSYGLMSGNLHGLTSILDAMTEGIYKVRYIILLYIITIQLINSFLFVFSF